MTESLIIIPTYNERENIREMIDAILSQHAGVHLLIVDDSSPDETAALAKQKTALYPGRLFIEERPGKSGLGTAYIHGFRWALAREYQYIFQMDADFSHNPQDLNLLYDACHQQGNDMAIGSRYIKGVNVVNWPMTRVLLSYFAGYYVRMVTGMPFSDTTAGFKCYRRKVLETITLDNIRFMGYAFQIEMKFLAWKYGFRIAEVPIIFADRVRGTSKISKGIIKEAIIGVLQIKLNSLFRNYCREMENDSHPLRAC